MACPNFWLVVHLYVNILLLFFSCRYVLGYKGNARQQCVQSRGPRESGMKVVHVVTTCCSINQLQSLLTDRLLQLSSSGDTEIQVGLRKIFFSLCWGDVTKGNCVINLVILLGKRFIYGPSGRESLCSHRVKDFLKCQFLLEGYFTDEAWISREMEGLYESRDLGRKI